VSQLQASEVLKFGVHLELVLPLKLELLGVLLEDAQGRKVFHASMKAEGVVKQDETSHASLPSNIGMTKQ